MTKIKVVDDPVLVAEIRKQLRQNGGYCPCRIDKRPETICMCLEFRKQETGVCHCGLYEKYEVKE